MMRPSALPIHGHGHGLLLALALAVILPIGAVCGARNYDRDEISLIQGSLRRHHLEESIGGRYGLLLATMLQQPSEAAQAPTPKPFDCAASPALCQEPFNCQNFSSAEQLEWFAVGMGCKFGRTNPRTWCAGAQYSGYSEQCLAKKDLLKAAQVQYNWSVEKKSLGGKDARALEVDASYCFIEGHCSNEAVTANTTLEEAEAMCDYRFGRTQWTEVGKFPTPNSMAYIAHMSRPESEGDMNGFHDRVQSKYFVELACVMGNYHCDVMYCKETYCKDPHWIKRYGHLASKVKGHLIQERGPSSMEFTAADAIP